LERSDNPPQPLRPLAGGSILERQRQPTTGPLRPLAAGCVPVFCRTITEYPEADAYSFESKMV